MSEKENYNEYLEALTEIYNREAAYREIDIDAAEDILNELSIQTAEDLAPALQYLDQSFEHPIQITDIFNAINSHLGAFLEDALFQDPYTENQISSPRNELVLDSSQDESINKSMLNKSIPKKLNRSQLSNINSSRLSDFQASDALNELRNGELDLIKELLNMSKANMSKKEGLYEIPIRTARKTEIKEFTDRLINIEKSLLKLFRSSSYYETLDYVIRVTCLEVSELVYNSFRKYIIDRFRQSFPSTPISTKPSAMAIDEEIPSQTNESVRITHKQSEQETWQISNKPEKDNTNMKDNPELVIQLYTKVEKQASLTYMNYFECLQEWFIHEDVHLLPLIIIPESIQEVNPEEQIVNKLRQNIQDYQEIRQNKLKTREDCSVIDSLISTLKLQLAKILAVKNLKPPIKSKPKNLEQNKLITKEKTKPKELISEEKSKDPLREIFEFYAKQQNNVVKVSLIEQLTQNFSVLNLAKFMRFLKEFEIMDIIKKKDRRNLDSNICKNIFKKNATNAKDMNYEQFVQALDMVAILYFNNEYDNIFNTDYKSLQLPEKRTKLYSFIGCDQPEIFRAKLKGFSVAFSTNTEYRIPENDLAKNYRYRPYNHQRMSIEEWKKQKQQSQPTQVSKPVRPIRQAETNSPLRKVSADPASLTQLKDLKKQTDSYLKKKIQKQPKTPFTWQGLGEMNPEQLKDENDDFDIKNLILQDESDEDEYLHRQYPLAVMSESFNSPVKPDRPKYESTKNLPVKSSVGNSRNYSPAIPGSLTSLKDASFISKQALERAQELNESQKKIQDDQLKRIMKIADAQIAKAKKMTEKLGKYKS